MVSQAQQSHDLAVSQTPWSFDSAVLLFPNGPLKVEIFDSGVLATGQIFDSVVLQA